MGFLELLTVLLPTTYKSDAGEIVSDKFSMGVFFAHFAAYALGAAGCLIVMAYKGRLGGKHA